MNEDGSTAITPPAENPQDTQVSTNPNELNFEMTQEQEQEYVDQILADGKYTPPVVDKPADDIVPPVADPATPPAVEEPAPIEKAPGAPAEIASPQTDDLWVEVERVVTDDLGEETTEMVKLVFDPNDPSSFIPDDFKAKNDKQLSEIMDAKAEMADLYRDRLGKYSDERSAEVASNLEKEMVAGWDAEIKDLVDSGVLEAPKLKEGDEGFDKDPANLRTDAVFKFMTDTNAERVKNGVPQIRSFALAHTMFENSEAKIAEAAAAKKDEEDTKLKGAMIGGSSAASGGTADQKAYTSGSHNNIWSIPVED